MAPQAEYKPNWAEYAPLVCQTPLPRNLARMRALIANLATTFHPAMTLHDLARTGGASRPDLGRFGPIMTARSSDGIKITTTHVLSY